jgi:subtilisin-like proprotein convertase family protein
MTDGFIIPDNFGRLDTIIISDHLLMYEVDAFVDIDHPSISELFIFVQSPHGERVILHNRTGGGGDSIVGWYDDELTPDGPGSFDQMVGDSSQGLWIFYVADRVAGQTGVVNSWGLRIIGTGVVDDVVEESDLLPGTFALRQNYPNPFNPATSISFALPRATHARLDVFDVLGRRVATLIDSDMPAGFHKVRYYGLWHPSQRKASARAWLLLILQTPIDTGEPLTLTDLVELLAQPTEPADRSVDKAEDDESDHPHCPSCGSGRTRLIGEYRRGHVP